MRYKVRTGSDISMKKHAYLIIAHNNFSQLQILVTLLDDPRNDIYLHVDKRAKLFRPDMIKVIHSDLILVDRIRVNWGGHSQIQCEMNLLKAAAQKQYAYYHLLSGLDLPLKTQEEIHSFFDTAYPNNFIKFDDRAIQSGSFLHRVNTYHLFQDHFGRSTGVWPGILRRLEERLLRLQTALRVQRKQYVTPYKGTNWFSITHELAEYVLGREALIKKQFYYTVCADEVFLHSVVMDSPYKHTVVNHSLRAIDWTRGEPYIYRAEDVDELLASGDLFGRKFDENIDRGAVEKVVAHLS